MTFASTYLVQLLLIFDNNIKEKKKEKKNMVNTITEYEFKVLTPAGGKAYSAEASDFCDGRLVGMEFSLEEKEVPKN